MPTHPDAIGYIRELGHAEGKPWLEMICDLAAVGCTSLNSADLEELVQLFTQNACYLRQPAPPATSIPAGTTITAIEHLESIGPFIGFKRLCNSLVASFPKRVTVIFGANGSGKSSLCEALQTLASKEVPRRPINNVQGDSTTTPSFSYKFASDTALQSWSPSIAYGTRSSSIKYFDVGIAIKNIENSVQPGRIIELSPFRLEIFETAKEHCETLRREIQRRQEENANFLTNLVDQIRAKFEVFEGTDLANLNQTTLKILDSVIKVGDNYSRGASLDEKLKRKTELEKATSEEGLKLLKGEVGALKTLQSEIQPILEASEMLVEIDPLKKSNILKSKEEELKIIAKTLIPSGATLDKLMDLIRSANEVCSLNSTELEKCPLCKQSLHESEHDLFKRYSAFLTGELETAISNLRQQLVTAAEKQKVVDSATPDIWAKDSVLDSEEVDEIRAGGKSIQAHFKSGKEIEQDDKSAIASLKDLNSNLSIQQKGKEKLIQDSEEGRESLLKQLNEIRNECQTLLYEKRVAENISLLRDANNRAQWATFWDSSLPDFTRILRRITDIAKKAHKELVVEDFRNRLNTEYLALAEKEMSAFGVELKDVGGDAAVTVNPHVSGQSIDTILSEGEQRVHALALFFAELETSKQQVIIFDDPVSSFDYNYIGNYCNRIRDFVQSHPNRQIIVLTHNWEFFVQIQTTLNRARLNNHLDIQVLESCISIDDYSENVDDLKTEIEVSLSITGEPTKSQKEIIAGKMRRLIEAIINTHVFNKQRHQFKQKTLQVSAFSEFTRVVPLLSAEAQTLRDLFEKLSIAEHDDPRNAYVNTDKVMFQTRFNTIKKIEAAIVGRK